MTRETSLVTKKDIKRRKEWEENAKAYIKDTKNTFSCNACFYFGKNFLCKFENRENNLGEVSRWFYKQCPICLTEDKCFKVIKGAIYREEREARKGPVCCALRNNPTIDTCQHDIIKIVKI